MSGQDNAKEDADLIRRISTGDRDAFEMLYKRYYHRLFRFIHRVIRRLDPIEELIDDVMFVVWQKADTFNHSCRASTWIFGIAYNKAIKSLYRTQRTPDHLAIDDLEEVQLNHSVSPIKQYELEDWLATAFDLLSPEQRAVMDLTYHHGMHYSEIAKLMGCPENTVKTRMFHARKKLQTLLPDLLDGLNTTRGGQTP